MEAIMKYLFALLLLLAPLPYVTQMAYSSTKKSLPQLTFKGVPFADDAKIVRKVFSIKIPGFREAYNPSIVSFQDGFILSFRYDNILGHKAFVGLVRLDKDFHVVGKPVIADRTHDIEDARLFWCNGTLYATGSRIVCKDPSQCLISLSKVDTETLSFTEVVDLDYHPQIVEKNWVPMVHTDTEGKSNLYFIYNHNPLFILKLSSFDTGAIEQPIPPSEFDPRPWEEKWGKIRGGTPTLELDSQYLAFFHSSFFRKRLQQCWVIGAVTFDKNPPFEMKSLSPTPLLAHGMYSTPYEFRFRKRLFRVAFPGGAVEVQTGNRTLFYLVYGENDSGIKVLAIDKKRLLASLKPVSRVQNSSPEEVLAVEESEKAKK
jgi:predicted GH43/DUF377 family glycosyl hydrolase